MKLNLVLMFIFVASLVCAQPKLTYEIINFSERGEDLYKVEVKFTNTGNKVIRNAKATAVLMDHSGKEICTQNHYVVKDDLYPGSSTYFSFVVSCSRNPATAKIHIERIR